MRATLAVVLARGLGTRLREDDGARLTDAQRAAAERGTKALMPVHGWPLLDHLLHALADGGVRDVVLVIAPDADAIRARYDDEAPPTRLRVRYAVQPEPRGTADALLAARAAVEAPVGAPRDDAGVRHFLVCNADNLYPPESIAVLVELDGPGCVAFDAAALTADGAVDDVRIRRFALLELAPDDTLRDIVEKPDASHPLAMPPAPWVSMNLWRFTDAIFDDCGAIEPSARGELELPDAVRRAIHERGARFHAVRQAVAVPDLSHRRDVAALEARLGRRTPRP
ncbi:MAG: sugar phosphate nucleotidyltransferase [Gemmatimonadaceae bacterium]